MALMRRRQRSLRGARGRNRPRVRRLDRRDRCAVSCQRVSVTRYELNTNLVRLTERSFLKVYMKKQISA